MSSTTTTTIDPALKQIYKPDNYRKSTYKRRPMFGLIPKSEDFGGRNMPLINEYGNPQGVSSVFSTAQSNATAMQMDDFLLTRVSLHSVATMDSEAIEATEMDKYAFIKGLTAKIDASMRALSDVIESYLPRSGTGAIGQISSGSNVATDTVTLATPADAHNFEVGMRLASATSETAAVSTGSSTGEVLEGVDRVTGDLTATSATWATVITGIAASDYLFRHGDAYNNASNKVFSGFAAWLPSSAPAAGTTFFGVDRYVDTRLYGNYYDGTALSIEEALVNGQSVASSMGGQVDTYFIQHTKARRLKLEIGTKEYFMKSARGPGGSEIADVNYQSIRISGDDGPIDVVAANKCPSTDAYGLELDTWVLATLGPAVKLNDIDGNRILRQSSSDGVEVRIVSRGQVGCKNPGANVRVGLPA